MQSSLASLLLLPLCASAILHRARRTDPCTCLSFKSVYDQGLATCGDALEFTQAIHDVSPEKLALYASSPKKLYPANVSEFLGSWATDPRKAKWTKDAVVQQKYCEDFLHKISSSTCVKVAASGFLTDRWYGQHWCYVSEQCKDVEVHPVNGKVSAKMCDKTNDDMLGSKTVDQVLEYAKEEGITDYELLLRMAFPYGGKDFTSLLPVIARQSTGDAPTRARILKLGAFTNGGYPVVYNLGKAGSPLVVVRKGDVSFVDASGKAVPLAHTDDPAINNKTMAATDTEFKAMALYEQKSGAGW